MRPRHGRTSAGTCRPEGRDRPDAGHTARSCFVWPNKRFGRRVFLGGTAGAVIGLQPVTAYGGERRKGRSLKPMDEIQGIGRLKILGGKLEEFKRVASQCMQVVRTKDTGT